MKNPMEGKKGRIHFDSGLSFILDFLEDNKLRWTFISQDNYGANDIENTHVEILNDGLIAIDWIEKDGLCVSYSLDINNKYLKSYMSWADENGLRGKRSYLVHEGEFVFINEDGSLDEKPFTNLEIAKDYFEKNYDDEIKAINSDQEFVFIETDNSLYKIKVEE